MSTHIQDCGHVHPPVKAVCERCHRKIFQRYGRNWFNCPDHMACCYRGQIPTGADLGVNHAHAPDPGLPAGRTATAEEAT